MAWGTGCRRALRLGLVGTLLFGSLGCGTDGDDLAKDVAFPPEPMPQILVAPTDLLLSLNTAEASTVMVENSGEAPLTIQSVVLTGTDVASFTIAADDCSGVQLSVGGTCGIDVAFTEAAATEQRSAALVIASNDPDNPTVQVGLTGGPRPLLSATPPALVFSLQRVNTASEPQTITFVNTGNVDLDEIALAFDADDGADFLLAEDGCSSGPLLAVGETCDVTVVFAPAQGGARSGTLTATTTAPPVSIALSGLAELGPFSVDSVAVDFGPVAVGAASAPTTLSFMNSGATALTVAIDPLGALDGTEFAVVAETCTASDVAVDGTCEIQVQFSPTSAGIKTASLSIEAAGETLAVALAGQGLGVGVDVSPGAGDFGDASVGATRTQDFTLTSTGNADLVIATIAVAGAEFSLVAAADTCTGATLVPAATCSFTVEYSPAGVGSHAGTVTIPSNGPDLTLDLTGNGVAAASLVPSTHSFGSLDVGSTATQAFVFANASENPVLVAGIDLTGASSAAFLVTAAADTCTGNTISPNASCTFVLRFAPTTEGGKFAIVTVRSDAPAVSAEVSGTGLALSPVGGVSPAGFAFGNQGMGLTSSAVTFTIKNTGLGDLILGAGFLDGADKAHFGMAQDLCSAHTLGPEESCTAQAVFTPTSFGAKSATLAFPSNDPAQDGAGNPIKASLTGFGVPALTATPRTLGFGTLALGLTTDSAEVSVSNLGSTPSPVGAVALSGADFLLAYDACSGKVLQPAGSCTVGAKFAPQKLGTLSGKIDIPSASGNIDIALFGISLSPVTVDPVSADAGDVPVGTSATVGTFTLTNVSGQRLAVGTTEVTYTSELKTGFSLSSDLCRGQILDTDGVCSFVVTVAPTDVGPVRGTVDLLLNGVKKAVKIPVAGFGI